MKLRLEPCNRRITTATGGAMQTKGEVKMELEIQGKSFKHNFIVMEKLASGGILGADFITEKGVTIKGSMNKAEVIMEIEEQEVAIATRKCTLTPNSITKIQIDKTKTEGVWMIEQERTEEEWSLIDGLINLENPTVLLRNNTSRNLYIERGTKIGTIAEVTIKSELKPAKETKERTQITPEIEKFIRENANLDQIPSERKRDYESLLIKNHDVFSKNQFDLGRTSTFEHKIRIKDKNKDDIIHVNQFRIPVAHEKAISDYVDELLKKGCIQLSKSPHNSPIFIVQKKGGEGIRVVLDFRKLNEITKPDKYIIRSVQESIDAIGRSKSRLFSCLDLASGFWQQTLEKESRKYTAFTVPGKGKYMWVVSPMGLSFSPASFSRLMDMIMKDQRNIITYIDDILAHAISHDEMIEVLQKCFEKLRENNLKLKLSKCSFGAKKVSYLGFTLSPEGVRPGVDKLGAVKLFPEPTTIRRVREFLGLTNYFRILIKDFSKKSVPLTELLRKEAEWKGGPLPEKAREAYKILKDELTKEPVIAFPRNELPFILSTDAACGDDSYGGGLGAILSQIGDDGKERPIAYASRSLKKHEKNYSPYLLELAAASWGIEHFHHYLYGQKRFILRTDHKPLEALSKIHTKTLNRLQVQMNEYNFKIEYRAGKENEGPDALSRNAIESLSSDWELAKLQKADKKLYLLRRFIEEGILPGGESNDKIIKLSRNVIIAEDGVMYITEKKGLEEELRVMVPESMTEEIIKAAHLTRFTGHGGVARTTSRIKNNYWWEGLTAQVQKFIINCETCQKAKARNPIRSPMQPLPIVDMPNQRVHMDLVGPLRTSSKQNKYIIVMTDAFTKYVELGAIPEKSAEIVAEAFFKNWIANHGTPAELVTDNGKEFTNEVLELLMKLLGTKKRTILPYAPQSNSAAESFNRNITKYCRTMINDNTLEWESVIPMIKLSYNTNVHKSTNQTPFFLTYLHEAKLPYFDLEQPKVFYDENWATAAFRKLQETYKSAKLIMEEAGANNKDYYDKASKERSFKSGEKILLKAVQKAGYGNKKFKQAWDGPYEITKVLSNKHVAIKIGRKEKMTHVDKILHFKQKEKPNSVQIEEPKEKDVRRSKRDRRKPDYYQA